jgi:putative DNA-invertase from lambdoid prophage Rac
MTRIAYYRVSTADQSVEAQRTAMGGAFDREFLDEGISGGTLAAQRPGFSALLSYVREGDTVSVYAIDRLGRDAIDVQTTVRDLMAKKVSIDVRGLGIIAKGAGEIIVAVLAQVAEMERERIRERCEAGRNAAKASLQATGRTHRGKLSLGRPKAADPREVAAWRSANGASIAGTAAQFGLSPATVKRYCGVAAQT